MQKRIAVVGSNGQVGKAFVKACAVAGLPYVAYGRPDFDVTDERAIERLFSADTFDVLINCTAYNFVDQAEKEPAVAYAVNADAVERMARLCAQYGKRFVHYSTDFVFDGEKKAPYTEDDEPNPQSVYGKSKRAGEIAALRECPAALVLRVSWVIGEGVQNFLYKLSQWAKDGRALRVADDEISVPTFADDIVCMTFAAMDKELRGLYHLCSDGSCSRYEMAKEYARLTGMTNTITPCPMSEFAASYPAKRPGYSAMSNAKVCADAGVGLRKWEDAMRLFCEARV
jgi:dTDP-4-dehydrorhamnose reductase